MMHVFLDVIKPKCNETSTEVFFLKYCSRRRLIDESEAGIAFRIPMLSKETFYSVTLTSRGVLQTYSSFIVLRQIIKEKSTILTKRKSRLIGIDKTNLLTVIDFPQNNSIISELIY
jgi:hypothetical protein